MQGKMMGIFFLEKNQKTFGKIRSKIKQMNEGMYIELSLCNRRANHITDKQKKRRELLAKIGVHRRIKVLNFYQ